MPYIAVEDRERAATHPDTVGELNYAITQLLLDYCQLREGGLRYQHINDVLGALEGAKLEFYRRVAVPYEDIKRASVPEVYILEHIL